MSEDVLRVRVAILEHADEPDELLVDAMQAELDDCALTSLANRLLELLLGLAHHLLDAPRVDPTVRDQAIQRETRELPTDRVVARDDHRFRRVVDDQVHTRGRLDGANVAPLTPDDAPLHVVVRELNHGDRAIGDELAGQPLDGDRHDLLRPAIRFFAGLAFDLPDVPGRFAAGLLSHLLHQGPPGLLARHARRLLELLAGGVDEGRDLGIAGLQPRFLRTARLFATCQLPLP